jgi:hypothetical protein
LHIVISLTYQPAHVKTECKRAATPPPFSLHPPPPPGITLLHYERMDTDFPLFPALCFILFFVHKQVVVFWQQCQWDQRGSIMLNFFETLLLKRFLPIAMISLLIFAYKSKVAKASGYDCLNCKHQPNVCKFLLGLEAQILDNFFLNRCRKMRIKNVQHSLRILGFALRSTPSLPSFHHSSSVIYSMH